MRTRFHSPPLAAAVLSLALGVGAGLQAQPPAKTDPSSKARLQVQLGTRLYPHVLAVSPDGQLVLSTSYEGLVLWHAATGRQLRTTYFYEIHDLVYSPDGRRILVASNNHGPRTLDVATGGHAFWKPEHKGPVWAVAFSADGKTAVSGSRGPNGRNMGRRDRQTVAAARGPHRIGHCRGPVKRRPAGSDRQRRTGPSACGTPAQAKLLWTSPQHPAAVVAVAFSADRGWALGISRDRTICAWDLATGKEVQRMPPPPGKPVPFVARIEYFPHPDVLSSDGKHVFRAVDKGVELWDLETGKAVRRVLELPERPVFPGPGSERGRVADAWV